MFTSVIMGLIGILVRAAMQIRKDRRTIAHLESQSTINLMMRDCIRGTRIARFLILKLTNGANEVLDGELKQYYATAINEEFSDINKSVINLYQRVLVDNKYNQMVAHAYTEGYYDFITEDETECDLKRFYDIEGIVQARIFFVHQFKGTVYYCTVASYERLETTKEEMELIQLTVDKIRESYKKYYV